MKTPVILFTGKGRVEVGETEVAAPGPGQLLVRTEKTLVSAGTELICLDRNFEAGTSWDSWVEYPFKPGYSQVGRVEAAGPDVSGFSPGERVFTRANHAGTVLVAAAEATKVPDKVSAEDAAWCGPAKIAQVGARRAEHRLGDCTVIVGLGPIGQLALRYAKLMGPRELVAIDPLPGRLALAKMGGATMTLDQPAGECLPAIKEATNGARADVVYDVTGAAAVLAPAIKLARKLGTVVLLGDTGSPSAQCLCDWLLTRGIKLVGAHDNLPPRDPSPDQPWSHQAMRALFLGYLERGEMSVSELTTHRFSYREAAAAYRTLRERKAETMGLVFDWE